MNEGIGKLTGGQVCPSLEEIRRLRRCWMDLGQRAEELESQRGEDMQRSGEYQETVVAVEELFHQVSREWDYLARYQVVVVFFSPSFSLYCGFHGLLHVFTHVFVTFRADTESTSEHLEALKKLSSDLEEQKTTLEDLRDQKYAILPRLSLLDKELVKQQVSLHFCGSSAFAFVANKSWFDAISCIAIGGSFGELLVPA